MREILQRDNPLLREIATPIDPTEFGSYWLEELIEEMLHIMQEKGAVGVAAPQIGIGKRVIVFGSTYSKRKPEIEIPNTVLINPTLKILSNERELDYEGCLNGGGIMGEVPRATEIEYSGFNRNGKQITKYATDLEARILQHEIDHLDGILFFDRIEDENTIISYEEYQKRLLS